MSVKNKTIGLAYIGVAGMVGVVGFSRFIFYAMDDTNKDAEIANSLLITVALTGVPLYFGVKRLSA
jgi:hypothetical protein